MTYSVQCVRVHSALFSSIAFSDRTGESLLLLLGVSGRSLGVSRILLEHCNWYDDRVRRQPPIVPRRPRAHAVRVRRRPRPPWRPATLGRPPTLLQFLPIGGPPAARGPLLATVPYRSWLLCPSRSRTHGSGGGHPPRPSLGGGRRRRGGRHGSVVRRFDILPPRRRDALPA